MQTKRLQRTLLTLHMGLVDIRNQALASRHKEVEGLSDVLEIFRSFVLTIMPQYDLSSTFKTTNKSSL